MLFKLYQRLQEKDVLVIDKSGDKADESLYLDPEKLEDLLTEEEVEKLKEFDDEEEEVEEIMIRLPNLNQLNSAFSKIMLLKEKIELNVY